MSEYNQHKEEGTFKAHGGLGQVLKEKNDKIKKLKNALEKSTGHLEYQVKLGCNCSLEDGKCNTCKQIEINKELIMGDDN